MVVGTPCTPTHRSLHIVGMESFLREPSRLVAEQQRITNEMVDISVAHYPVFIKSSRCCSEVLKEAHQNAMLTERLQSEEQGLRQCMGRLTEKGQEWKRGRQQLRTLRSSQEVIRDMLELPTILENCLRNELYHEAVLLHEKVESLLTAAPNISIIKVIASEVEDTMRKHLPQLLSKLSTSLSPAQCIKIISFLSRLKIIPNRELRKLFLARRLQYLQSLLKDVQRGPFTYLNKVCNVIGVNLPAVITEYNSSFKNRDGKLSTYDTDHDTPVCDVLGAWLAGVVSNYLNIIRKHLPMVTCGGELKQLLTQSQQCGKELAKKGVDIRPVLYDMFSKRILNLWEQGIDGAYSSFQLSLGNHTWTNKHSTSALKEPRYERTGVSTAPPQLLRQYLPLGYLTNGILSALNEVRRCALTSLTPQTIAKLSATLSQCVADVVDVYNTQSLDENELQGYLAFIKVMHDDLLPYIGRCIDIMLSTSRGLAVRDIGEPLMTIHKEHVKRKSPEGEHPPAAASQPPGPAQPAAQLAQPFPSTSSLGDVSLPAAASTQSLDVHVPEPAPAPTHAPEPSPQVAVHVPVDEDDEAALANLPPA
eukprot:TRINITY_DN14580_c0_g1_i1.p1 TRINITY_DN14580_c0_g1~~TRINITY_DN14580_c0_g1_i1.p1  ORF type:complete len:590 (+),score=192.64 TRINITY_DN14580_c0_g1_i1:39-1808(+)